VPRRLVPVAVVAALTMAACSTAGTEGRSAPRPATTTAAATPSAAPSPTAAGASGQPVDQRPPEQGGPEPDGTLTLAFGGDVHFASQLAALLVDPSKGLSELRPYLATADLAMVNLETAITTRGSEQPKKFHFRAPATSLDALAGAGVDVVTMANNHAVDYGRQGLDDTLAARDRSPVPVVGVGRDRDDALSPAVLTAERLRVAFLGATQVPDWTLATWPAGPGRAGVAAAADPARLVQAVREARRRADVVVVYLHWGTDYTDCPNPLQRRTAAALAEAGADVVVGTHAHRVQGAGWLGATYVDYGLGNFVWWRRNSEQDSRSGVLTLTLKGRRVVGERWTPMRVSSDGIPRVPAAGELDQLSDGWQQSRRCTGLADAPPS
jgi:hypothetical protein